MSHPRSGYEVEAVVPMYNEQDCCVDIARRLHTILSGNHSRYRIHFMIGGTDDTFDKLHSAFLQDGEEGDEHPSCFHVDGERGLGVAIRSGLLCCSRYSDYVLTMDGDGQCLPEEFSNLWYGVNDILIWRRHDAAIGYQAPSCDSRGRTRRLKSALATKALKLRYGISVKSLTLNYRLYRMDAIAAVREGLRSRDFAIQPEILIAMKKAGFDDLVSVPLSFPQRAAGSSKAKLTAMEYLRLLK